MKVNVKKRQFSLLIPLITIFLSANVCVWACAWLQTEHSVRFNAYYTPRQLELLPPLPKNSRAYNNEQQSWHEKHDVESMYVDEEKVEQALGELWEKAQRARARNDLSALKGQLTIFLDKTVYARELPADLMKKRNSAIDQLDALRALEQGSSPDKVTDYLSARTSLDKSSVEPDFYELLQSVKKDPNLRDNAEYLRAADLYQKLEYNEAASRFFRLAARYPDSEKREAALYMAAICALKQSLAYTSYLEQSDDLDVEFLKDEYWQKARQGFARVMREYPRGRYYNDARGWLAFLAHRTGDRVTALVNYYQMLAEVKDLNARLEGGVSLTLTRHHASEEEMEKVEAHLANKPAAALAYAYHELYNYPEHSCGLPGVSDSPANFCFISCFSQQDEEGGWELKHQTGDEHSIRRVAAFATRMMKRYPASAINGPFVNRLAMAQLEINNNEEAQRLAEKALKMGLEGEEPAYALWVLGVARYRMKDHDRAIDALTNLVEQFPRSRFTENTHRLLAMAYEDIGDLTQALHHYLAINYYLDAVYIMDVLMPVEQLEAYVNTQRENKRYNEILYSLGVRHLRAGNLERAEAAFNRVHPASFKMSPYADEERDQDAKSPEYYSNWQGVKSAWLLADYKTIENLEGLHKKIESAQGDEARAEALYQLGAYHYEASQYIYYNPLWNGERYMKLHEIEELGGFRAAGEEQRLWQYFQSHESYSRALDIFLEVAERYPNTRAAKDALYSAAVCHERLANYNYYWREAYSRGLHSGKRMVTYDDVRRTYPRYAMPLGTYCWQPVTRTCSGEPAWAAPPKPQPRPTWARRFYNSLVGILDIAGMTFANNLPRMLYSFYAGQLLGVMILGMHFYRISREKKI